MTLEIIAKKLEDKGIAINYDFKIRGNQKIELSDYPITISLENNNIVISRIVNNSMNVSKRDLNNFDLEDILKKFIPNYK